MNEHGPVPDGTGPIDVRTAQQPLVLPISRSLFWLGGTALLALLVYSFIGVDQGAVSVFGSDAHVHEFMHDGRHFLGFPCH